MCNTTSCNSCELGKNMTNTNELTASENGVQKCGFCKCDAIYKCANCKRVAYCSREHQKIHWKKHKDFCVPVEVQYDEKVGRCLVTIRDIAKDSIIIKENPMVIGPKFSSPSTPVCLNCLKPLVQPEVCKCPKCDWLMCCPQCSKGSSHQLECYFLSRTKHRTQQCMYEAITPLRSLLLQKQNPTKWKKLSQMQSHIEFRTEGTEIYREVENIASYLKILTHDIEEELGDISEDTIHKICGILDINAIDVNDDVSAIYETFSKIEHNCVPNIRIAHEGHTIVVRAATNIAKNEHISTMYTSCLWTTKARRQHLWDTKYFKCNCERCQDPTELGTDFGTLKCIQTNENTCEKCSGFLRSKNPLDDGSAWECSNCYVLVSADKVDSIMTNLGNEMEQLIQGNPTVEKVENLIKTMQLFLHPHNQYCFELKHLLIQALGHQPGYLHNELLDETLEKKISTCKELMSIASKLDPYACRMPLYIAVINYELTSAMLEQLKRGNDCTESQKSKAIQIRYLLTQCLDILKYDTYPSREYDLKMCCQKLIDKMVIRYCLEINTE